jgi:hypothetical protein
MGPLESAQLAVNYGFGRSGMLGPESRHSRASAQLGL